MSNVVIFNCYGTADFIAIPRGIGKSPDFTDEKTLSEKRHAFLKVELSSSGQSSHCPGDNIVQ